MTFTPKSTISLLASLFALGLAGCSMTSVQPVVTGAPNTAIGGRAFGGQQPISGATVQVRAAGTAGYGSADTILATTTSDGNGNFGFAANAYTCPQANTPVYIVATGGDPGMGANNPNIAIAAGLGSCSDAKNAFVIINEVTTAATAYALAQFFTPTLGTSSTDSFGGPSSTAGSVTTYSKGLTAANAVTIPTIVNNAAGLPNTSNTNIIVESQKLLTIGNILAACINSGGVTGVGDTTSNCGQLFAATTPPGGSTAPSDTLQAAVQMAKYPYQNVATLLFLNSPSSPFGPGLSTVNDWTVGVKYTTTSMALTVNSGTTSNLDIDASGNIWLPSTAPAGVAVFSPSNGTFSGPYTTSGLSHPQNIAINSTGLVYATDANSGLLAAYNANGSSAGSVNSGLTSLGSVAIGPTDQLWYTGSNGIVNPVNELTGGILSVLNNLLTGYASHPVQSLSIAANNDVYSSSSSGTTGYIEKYNASNPILPTNTVVGTYANAGVGQLALNGSTIVRTTNGSNTFCPLSGSCATASIAGMSAPQGIVTDGAGKLWFANSGAASVSSTNGSANSFTDFAGIAYKHTFTMVQPYGIGVDASGNVWVSNQTAVGGPYVLSELIGAAAPTITPISAQIAGGTSQVGTKPTN